MDSYGASCASFHCIPFTDKTPVRNIHPDKEEWTHANRFKCVILLHVDPRSISALRPFGNSRVRLGDGVEGTGYTSGEGRSPGDKGKSGNSKLHGQKFGLLFNEMTKK